MIDFHLYLQKIQLVVLKCSPNKLFNLKNEKFFKISRFFYFFHIYRGHIYHLSYRLMVQIAKEPEHFKDTLAELGWNCTNMNDQSEYNTYVLFLCQHLASPDCPICIKGMQGCSANKFSTNNRQ